MGIFDIFEDVVKLTKSDNVIKLNDVDMSKVTKEELDEARCKWLMVEGWEVRYYDLFLKYKDEILSLFAFDAKLRAKVLAYMRSAEGGETEEVIRLRQVANSPS